MSTHHHLGVDEFDANPVLPRELEFYRRALNQLPTDVIVIDGDGRFKYGNQSVSVSTGIHVDDATIGEEFIGYIHPDDLGWLLEAFARVLDADDVGEFGRSEVWRDIHARVITAAGETVPVVLTGINATNDPYVEGMVIHMRSGRTDELVRDVLRGVATGEPIRDLIGLLLDETVAIADDLEAAIVERASDGSVAAVLGATAGLNGVVRSLPHEAVWPQADGPARTVTVDEIGGDLAAALRGADFVEFVIGSVPMVDERATIEVLIAGVDERRLKLTLLQHLDRVRDLLSVLLLREDNDRRLRAAAQRDPLTGLLNRSGMWRGWSELGGRDIGSVLYLDLDRFKPINDQYGHLIGDRVLQVVAERLRGSVRADDIVARVGGDEFVVLVSATGQGELGADQRGAILRQRIIDVLGQPIVLDDLTLSISASVGLALHESDTDLDALLSRADREMYLAKRGAPIAAERSST